MARNRVAYATVPPGSQNVEGVLPVVSPNYDIILDRRRTWWWEPGPVDSCCFCCHPEGGIMVLAGLKAAANAILLLLIVQGHKVGRFFTHPVRYPMEYRVETTQELYMSGCKSGPPTILAIFHCLRMKQKIDALQKSIQDISPIDSFYGYFTIFCVLVGLAGGVAGLWASCGRNTFAAKLFFLSWPASLALSIVSSIVKSIIIHWLVHNGPIRFTPLTFMLAIQVFFYIYFLKVSWSYYTVLKIRDTKALSSIESDIELRGIGE